jgi:hypothetical protein
MRMFFVYFVIITTEYTQSGNGCFLATFHHDGKIFPGWRGRGGARPPSFTLFIIMYRLQCTLQLRGQLHLPYFIISSLSLCTLRLFLSVRVRRVICETDGGYRITVRTSRPIKKGEEIFNTYLDILQPTLLPRSLLAESKLMHCW